MQTKFDNKTTTFHKFLLPSTWVCIYVIYTHSSPPSWSASSNFAAIQSRKTEKMSQLTSHKRARAHHGLQKQNVKTRTSRSQLETSRFWVDSCKAVTCACGNDNFWLSVYVFYSQTCLYLSCMLNCSSTSRNHTVRLTVTCFWTG